MGKGGGDVINLSVRKRKLNERMLAIYNSSFVQPFFVILIHNILKQSIESAKQSMNPLLMSCLGRVTYPLPANSPTIHSRLVCKVPKTQKNFKTFKIMSRGMQILAIHSSTRSIQSKPFGCNRQLRTMQWDRLTSQLLNFKVGEQTYIEIGIN